MEINIDDWVFDVNKDETENYYRSIHLCDCTPCQNYHSTIKSQYPKLNDFLSQFGVDIERPEETMWFEDNIVEQTVWYWAWYTVSGTIDNIGINDIESNGLIIISPSGVSPNTEMDEPYFMLEVHLIIWDIL